MTTKAPHILDLIAAVGKAGPKDRSAIGGTGRKHLHDVFPALLFSNTGKTFSPKVPAREGQHPGLVEKVKQIPPNISDMDGSLAASTPVPQIAIRSNARLDLQTIEYDPPHSKNNRSDIGRQHRLTGLRIPIRQAPNLESPVIRSIKPVLTIAHPEGQMSSYIVGARAQRTDIKIGASLPEPHPNKLNYHPLHSIYRSNVVQDSTLRPMMFVKGGFAQPVSDIPKRLGWRVTINDHFNNFPKHDHGLFSSAKEIPRGKSAKVTGLQPRQDKSPTRKSTPDTPAMEEKHPKSAGEKAVEITAPGRIAEKPMAVGNKPHMLSSNPNAALKEQPLTTAKPADHEPVNKACEKSSAETPIVTGNERQTSSNEPIRTEKNQSIEVPKPKDHPSSNHISVSRPAAKMQVGEIFARGDGKMRAAIPSNTDNSVSAEKLEGDGIALKLSLWDKTTTHTAEFPISNHPKPTDFAPKTLNHQHTNSAAASRQATKSSANIPVNPFSVRIPISVRRQESNSRKTSPKLRQELLARRSVQSSKPREVPSDRIITAQDGSKEARVHPNNPEPTVTERTISPKQKILHDNLRPAAIHGLNGASTTPIRPTAVPPSSASRWDGLVQFVEKIMQGARVIHRSDGLSEMKVRLSSESLGRMMIQLSVADNHVDIRFALDTHQAKQLLQSHRSELVQILKDSGASSVTIDVSTSSADGFEQNRQPGEAGDRSPNPRYTEASPRSVPMEIGLAEQEDPYQRNAGRMLYMGDYSSMVWVA
jgi:flagellar hook-length control protein FliK